MLRGSKGNLSTCETEKKRGERADPLSAVLIFLRRSLKRSTALINLDPSIE